MELHDERLPHINFIMDDIHESVNAIYEALADKEYEECRSEISTLTKKLKSLQVSLNDNI